MEHPARCKAKKLYYSFKLQKLAKPYHSKSNNIIKTKFKEINTHLQQRRVANCSKRIIFIYSEMKLIDQPNQQIKFVQNSNQKSTEGNSKLFKDRRSDPFCLMTQIPHKASKTCFTGKGQHKRKNPLWDIKGFYKPGINMSVLFSSSTFVLIS